jgi:hypothetical protein
MADELDAQEPEVQEEATPTAEQVPQQALFEPRNIAEAMEMPEPEPEPVAEPAPEQELPEVGPDWLNEPPPQPQYPPQFPVDYPPHPEYPTMQPQYPQQPQATPRTPGDAALEAFVDNPQAWLDQQLAAREQQLLGPIQQQQQSIAFMMHQMQENSLKQTKQQARAAIEKAYKEFNKDSAFRSSKDMQESVKGTLQGMMQRAEIEARNGNWEPMNTLINMDQGEIAGTLAYLRAKAGVQSGGQAPLQVEGAAVESSRSPAAKHEVQLTPEQEEIARRMGPGYRARLVKSLQELDENDDLEWS